MITINLYDYNFGPEGSYSCSYQVPKYVRYIRGLKHWDGVTLFTDEYINSPVVDEVESRYKVGWLHEPYCLHPTTYSNCVTNSFKFDFILTYCSDLTHNDPMKYNFSPYGGIWIDSKLWSMHPKYKLASMLFGEKRTTAGHLLRHEIYERIKDSDPRFQFYGLHGIHTDYGQNTKLTVLKDYCFSVVVETCREDGLFTEILLDCFAVGTIPIFWGAPDVGEFFDERGIISFERASDIDNIMPLLSEKLYGDMLPYARANFKIAQEYACIEDWQYEHYYKEMQ